MNEIEVHPFAGFIPKNITVLIVGSFPGKEITRKKLSGDEWFYSSRRNQFWPIISSVYQTPLVTKKDKQQLCEKYGIGLVDVFLKARRKDDNNTDANLEIIEMNDKALISILKNPAIKKIFFTSKFVEKIFNKNFPGYSIGECLPSPSPRYATMNKEQKINDYRLKLPPLIKQSLLN